MEKFKNFIEKYRDQKNTIKELKEQLKAANGVLDKLEREGMAMLSESGMNDGIKINGLGQISIKQDIAYRVPQDLEAKQKLYDYIMRKYGQDTLEGMRSINSQTLNSWAKKEFESGEPFIDGLEIPSVTDYLYFREDK